jgi:hypothetical protein
MPLVAFFRRRESRRFFRGMSAAVDQLQLCRGSASGDWRWRFVSFETMGDGNTFTKRVLRVFDLFYHVGPLFSVRIVSGERALRDQNTEMETLL